MAVNSLSMDVYLPALPAMTEMLGPGAELTISGYLFGFMIAQLVWGPISDSIGRIKPLLWVRYYLLSARLVVPLADTMTVTRYLANFFRLSVPVWGLCYHEP